MWIAFLLLLINLLNWTVQSFSENGEKRSSQVTKWPNSQNPKDIQCLITSDKHTETSDFNNYHRYISNQPPTQWSLQNYSSVLLSIGNLGRNDFRGWPIIDIWEPKNSDINILADNIYYLYLHILKPFLQWSSNCGFQTIMMIIYSLRINFIVHNDINALKLLLNNY